MEMTLEEALIASLGDIGKGLASSAPLVLDEVLEQLPQGPFTPLGLTELFRTFPIGNGTVDLLRPSPGLLDGLVREPPDGEALRSPVYPPVDLERLGTFVSDG